MSKKQGLLEAAAEIFNANRSSKQATGDAFGAGTQLHNTFTSPTIVDLGPAHIKANEPFVDFTKGVPTATPPGKTPPVGSEPKKVLPKQTAQTAGVDPVDPEKLPNQDYQKISHREETPGHCTVKPGQGNVMPSWAHESFVVSLDDLISLLDEAKDWKDDDNDADDKGKKVVAWKQARKASMKADSKATKKGLKEGLEEFLQASRDYSDDVNAIFSDEDGISDEFKTKAKTIFEAAVSSRVSELAESLEAAFYTNLDEAIETAKEELEGQVNDYLDYMVKEWMTENEIAIEKGLRTEIAEDFIGALRNLFMEHYIDIPEDKVDLIGELTEKVAALETQLNTQVSKNIEVSKELGEAKKADAVRQVCEGLTQTQVEKVRSLAEGVEFTTESEFTEKMQQIKESYFPTKIKTPSRDALNDNTMVLTEETHTHVVTDPFVQAAVKALSRGKI